MISNDFSGPRYPKKSVSNKVSIILCLLLLFGCIYILPMFVNVAGFFIGLGLFFYIGFMDNKSQHKEYIKNYNKHKTEFTEEGKMRFVHEECNLHPGQKTQYVDLGIRMLAMFAKINNGVTESELEIIYDYISKQDCLSEKHKKNLKIYLEQDYVLEDLAYAAYWFHETVYDFTTFGCEILLERMFQMGYSDGEFSYEEMLFTRKAAYHMYITEKEYKKILMEYIKHTGEENPLARYAEQSKQEAIRRDGGYWYRDRKGQRQWMQF